MKRILLLLLPLFLIGGQIEWRKDFDTALKESKETHKPIMAFYESHHCSWCEKMLTTTFKDPKVIGRVNSLFVPVRIYKEAKNYPAKIHSKYTPTTFFLTPDLQPIIRPVLGYWNSEAFLSYIDDVQRKVLK